jgi:hypothetical protein
MNVHQDLVRARIQDCRKEVDTFLGVGERDESTPMPIDDDTVKKRRGKGDELEFRPLTKDTEKFMSELSAASILKTQQSGYQLLQPENEFNYLLAQVARWKRIHQQMSRKSEVANNGAPAEEEKPLTFADFAALFEEKDEKFIQEDKPKNDKRACSLIYTHLPGAFVADVPLKRSDMPMVARKDDKGQIAQQPYFYCVEMTQDMVRCTRFVCQKTWVTFLEDLEKETFQAVQKKCAVSIAEFTNILHQRLFVNEPRLKQIEKDIYQVRIGSPPP